MSRRCAAERCDGCRLPPLLDSSPFLQQLLAGQGLTDAPLRWPTNVSFLALLHAVGVTRPGFAVDIGAGDGQRLDNYKRALNPVLPLFRAGWAGLSVEEDAVYDGRGGAQSKGMPFASSRRSEVLALHNASGGIRVAWAAALPSNIGALLEAAGAPMELDALHVDVDGLELPLLRAVLDAGYAPKVVALQFNADVPPPVYWSMAWREGGARPAGHQRTSAGPSAAALWHALSEAGPSGSRYSLVAFQLGRWARWCQRCEQRMWFVRRPLLGAGAAPLISLAQLSRMFWAAVVASTLAPRVPPRAQTSRPRHTAAQSAGPSRPPCPPWLPSKAPVADRAHPSEAAGSRRAFAAQVQPGKLLSHSSRVVSLLAQQAEEQARRAAAPAPSGSAPRRGRRRRRRRRLAEAPWRASNVSKLGWCLRADPCPLNALTHPPVASEAPAPCVSADGEVGLAAGGVAEAQPQLQLHWQWVGRHVLGMTQRRAGVLEAETRLLDDPRPLGGATRTRTLLHGRYAQASARLGLPAACALVQQLRDSCTAEQPGCAAYDFETGLVRSDSSSSSSRSSVAMCGAGT